MECAQVRVEAIDRGSSTLTMSMCTSKSSLLGMMLMPKSAASSIEKNDDAKTDDTADSPAQQPAWLGWTQTWF